MGEGLIVRRGGSGGAKLRVMAVASASALPESAKDGSIAIISSTAVGMVYAQATQPLGWFPTGDVWVQLGTTSSIPINMVNKGVLMLYPLAVYQYSGEWVDCNAYVRMNGAWEALALVLYQSGNQIKNVTGGWEKHGTGTMTLYNNCIYLYAGTGNRCMATTVNAIDVTKYGTLEVTGAAVPSGGAATTTTGSVRIGLTGDPSKTMSEYGDVKKTNAFVDGSVCRYDISGYLGDWHVVVEAYNTRKWYCKQVRLLP